MYKILGILFLVVLVGGGCTNEQEITIRNQQEQIDKLTTELQEKPNLGAKARAECEKQVNDKYDELIEFCNKTDVPGECFTDFLKKSNWTGAVSKDAISCINEKLKYN
jgi:hypothetical protein